MFEGGELSWGWREAGEIESEAAEEGGAVGFGGGGEVFGFEFGQDEGVDGGAEPIGAFGGRQGMALDGGEGPVGAFAVGDGGFLDGGVVDLDVGFGFGDFFLGAGRHAGHEQGHHTEAQRHREGNTMVTKSTKAGAAKGILSRP